MNRSLPEQSRIRVESFSDTEGNLRSVVDQANRMFDYVYKMLDGRLRIGDHVEAQTPSIQGFDPALLPLFLSYKLPAPARGCVVLSASVSGGAFVNVGAAFSVGWRHDGANLRITELPGLTPGTKYDLTFLVV